jgi:hypothetical protein
MSSSQLVSIYKNFLKKTINLTLSLFVFYAVILFSLPGKYISPAIPVIILFFAIFTSLIFYYQIKAILKKTSKFVNFFLIATVLKLMLFLVLVLVYALLNKGDAVNFIISFFVIYLVFSAFELVQLLKVQDKMT